MSDTPGAASVPVLGGDRGEENRPAIDVELNLGARKRHP
jgi:hypothetical protein